MSTERRVYLSSPHMSGAERDLLLDAYDSNWIAPLGPHVDGFERELGAYVGMPHVAALSAGTAALHLSLLLLGVSRGDEVWVSSFTFSASANPITYVGAEPVFVDANRETWNMDPELLAAELRRAASAGRLPKAVIVVDLYGQCADYDPIIAACDEYGVPIIEDAAEALGATYKGAKAGTFGRLSVLSFNGNKIITTSGGGALMSHDAKLIAKARFLATQARDDAPHYQHSHIGYNYRMSNLLAAVGRGQLQSIEDRVAARRAHFDGYAATIGSLPGIGFMPEAPYGRANRWLTCITVDPQQFGATREDIRLALEAENIESRPTWKPMHLQSVFADCRVLGGSVSAEIFENGLCLPSGSSMSAEDRERVVAVIRDVHAGRGGR